MNIKKYLFGVMAIALCGLMTSCDTDNIGAKYNPSFQNVSFEVEKASTITTSETTITVPVRVTRSLTSGSYTANYTLTSENEGVFSSPDNGAVTFAEGSGVAYINLVASNLEKGKDYSCKIALSEKDVATTDTITKTQVTETIISIHADYNWVAAGTCKFIDFNFADDEENGEAVDGVKIENGEGSNVYRIIDPYRTLYGSSVAAGNITFTQNADGSIQLTNGRHCTVGSYTIYSDNVDYGAYCYVENVGNHYAVNHLLLAGTSLYIGYFEFIWNK